MIMKISLVIVLVISATITEALKCAPCTEIKCRPLHEMNCKGGLVRDPIQCGCCATCAKLIGEECGGLWNIGGVCDCGLKCIKDPAIIKQGGGLKADGKCHGSKVRGLAI